MKMPSIIIIATIFWMIFVYTFLCVVACYEEQQPSAYKKTHAEQHAEFEEIKESMVEISRLLYLIHGADKKIEEGAQKQAGEDSD